MSELYLFIEFSNGMGSIRLQLLVAISWHITLMLEKEKRCHLFFLKTLFHFHSPEENGMECTKLISLLKKIFMDKP